MATWDKSVSARRSARSLAVAVALVSLSPASAFADDDVTFGARPDAGAEEGMSVSDWLNSRGSPEAGKPIEVDGGRVGGNRSDAGVADDEITAWWNARGSRTDAGGDRSEQQTAELRSSYQRDIAKRNEEFVQTAREEQARCSALGAQDLRSLGKVTMDLPRTDPDNEFHEPLPVGDRLNVQLWVVRRDAHVLTCRLPFVHQGFVIIPACDDFSTLVDAMDAPAATTFFDQVPVAESKAAARCRSYTLGLFDMDLRCPQPYFEFHHVVLPTCVDDIVVARTRRTAGAVRPEATGQAHSPPRKPAGDEERELRRLMASDPPARVEPRSPGSNLERAAPSEVRPSNRENTAGSSESSAPSPSPNLDEVLKTYHPLDRSMAYSRSWLARRRRTLKEAFSEAQQAGRMAELAPRLNCASSAIARPSSASSPSAPIPSSTVNLNRSEWTTGRPA